MCQNLFCFKSIDLFRPTVIKYIYYYSKLTPGETEASCAKGYTVINDYNQQAS